jgi:methionine synthase I (cobalamin-dependent)
LLEALSRGPVLLDAAMGTRLAAQGLDLDQDDPALWNISHPEAVRAVHERDIAAGSDALVTNTFGANRSWLTRFGAEADVVTLNHAAVELARAAAGPNRILLGSIGPYATATAAVFTEQADSLIEFGIGALVLETHSVRRLDRCVFRACCAAAGIPVVISCFDWPTGSRDLGRAAVELLASGAWGLGFNCHSDLAAVVSWAKRIRRVTDAPLYLKPSAVLPPRTPYGHTDLTPLMGSLRGMSRLMVGGCCGTSEDHIAALRAALDAR